MADQQIRDLTEETEPGGDDLVYVVTDPDGTPANRKVKLSNLPGSGANGIEGDDGYVETGESAGTDSYTDLTTTGPSATVDVPASGVVVVSIGAQMVNASGWALASFSASGENTFAASDSTRILAQGGNSVGAGRTFRLTGLNPGTTTFTMKYRRASGGSGTFSHRNIVVETRP